MLLERELRADVEVCRSLLSVGSKSFSLAARLLPARVRDAATVLYAFCRVADDLVDRDPAASNETVHALRERLQRAYAGRPDDTPVDRALSRVVERERVPRGLLEALLEGLAWDAIGRRYETLDDLVSYAARVAGSVGVTMSLVMGARDPSLLARACDLGVAMQLTNIARDVGEDAAVGRLYLPLEWLRDAGVDWSREATVPEPRQALVEVIARLLREADALYARADTGIDGLPRDYRLAIQSTRLIYTNIKQLITQTKTQTITKQTIVSK